MADLTRQNPLIQVQNLGISFKGRSRGIRPSPLQSIVRQVSLSIVKGDTFCLIGESGSGKSTLALALTGLVPFQSGNLVFQGKKIQTANDRNHKHLIRKTQMVFQDPVQALNPFLPLGRSLEEPMKASGIPKKERKYRIATLIKETHLTEELLKRLPAQASGGQNQRVCIARALSVRPELLILDEPLTALDSLIKTRLIGMLCRLKKAYPVTCFVISHDMGLVSAMATRIGVMYLGRMMEIGSRQEILSHPAHPYTRALLSASFIPGIWEKQRLVLKGEAPSVQDQPRGCVFHSRCPQVMEICKKSSPDTLSIGPGHTVSCHLYTPELEPCLDS